MEQKQDQSLDELILTEKAQAAEIIGENVGTIMHKALEEANQLLKQYGFKASVILNFHKLDNSQENQ